MSFPNVIFGDYGDEKVAQSTKISSLPLGTLMHLPDGREFRHARAASGTALTAGYLYQQAAVPADTMIAKSLVSTAAVGATSVAFTTGGTTAITTDMFADGYLYVASSTGTGVGRNYKAKGNNSAASGSTTCTVDLETSDPIETAIGGTTATIGMRANPFSSAVITTADTVWTGKFLGIPPMAVSAGFYYWSQTKGEATAFVAGTILVAGEGVVASTAVAGALAAFPTAAADTAGVRYAKQSQIIGNGMSISLTNGFSLVDLQLD